MEYDVRDAVEMFEVGGGVRFFWRGVREKGGSSEPPEPPLVTGLCFTSVSSQHGALDALCELYYEFHMHNIMYVIRVSFVVALSYNLVFQNSNAWYGGH